jgi:RNA polymerase sigma factor (sigma-70 family)
MNDNLQQEWEHWYPRVYSYFYKRVDNKTIVEDLTAETMNTVFIARDGVNNLTGYIWKVAHNYLVKFIKTKTTTPMMVSLNDDLDAWEPPAAEETLTVERAGYTERMTNLSQCINHSPISDEERSIINFSVLNNLNSTEISQRTNLKPDTVRQKLKRALEKIRKECLYLWK